MNDITATTTTTTTSNSIGIVVPPPLLHNTTSTTSYYHDYQQYYHFFLLPLLLPPLLLSTITSYVMSILNKDKTNINGNYNIQGNGDFLYLRLEIQKLQQSYRAGWAVAYS